MPVHNAVAHVRGAIDSILGQTFADLELVVVDDGSTDGSGEVIRQYTDQRIRLIGDGTNRGVGAALNLGISTARGRIIARMDADDVSDIRRLEKQVSFLDMNPDVDLVGSAITLVKDEYGREKVIHVPTSPGQVRWQLYFGNSIGHMTVTARRSLFEETGGYDETLRTAQDYDLWLRANENHRMANLAEPLVKVRALPGSTSRRLAETRETNAAASLSGALTNIVGSTLPVDLARLLMAPSLLRNNPSWARYAVDAVEIVRSITTHCTAQASPSETRWIAQHADYKMAQLVMYSLLMNRPKGVAAYKRSGLSPIAVARGTASALFRRARASRDNSI